MKPFSWLLITLVSSCSISFAQIKKTPTLSLRTGAFVPAQVSAEQLQYFHNSTLRVAGQQFAVLQFESIPNAVQRKKLREHGIVLLDYIPANAYTASIAFPLTTALLKTLQIRAILPLPASLKMDSRLTEPANQGKEQDVMLAYFPGVPYDTVALSLAENGFTIIDTDARSYHLLKVKVPAGKINELANLPFVLYIDQIPPAPEELNFESTHGTKANILKSTLPGGYHLTGEGITNGIIEGASTAPFPHVDFIDRLVQGDVGNNGHATHVYGIVAGAGNVKERNEGYAPKSRIIGALVPFSISLLPHLVNNMGLVAVNHSYGSGFSCRTGYLLTMQVTDKIPIDFPTLLYVYAAGNSGNLQCGDYPLGFGTAVASNVAKNALTVGYADGEGRAVPGSSKGPGYGGRIKPEIVAPGNGIVSTAPNNGYAINIGSSMASPAVVGGLSLLNQRYRQLNNNHIPNGALMKAVICNTATDQGNPGPDYNNGFGCMNLLRAVRSLDHHWYTVDSVSNQTQKQHTIQVPPGTKQLKVMVYWHDAPLNSVSSRILIHDLDLRVTSSSGSTTLPWVLDTIPANLMLPATRKEDHLNNIEQVTIDNPTPGAYTVTVRGTEIGQYDHQAYYLVYDIIDDEVEMTYPSGGERMVPGENVFIRWDDAPGNTSPYTLEFSADDGATWQLINAAVPSTARLYQWTFPPTATSTARIRITRNNDHKQSTGSPFVMIGLPQWSFSGIQCPGYIRIQWPAVDKATDYEVCMLRNGQTQPVGTTSNTSYTIPGLSTDSVYWVSVRARLNGVAGLRAPAIAVNPANGNCSGNISDGDLQLSAILSPQSGRKFTSTALTDHATVKIKIRNLDDQPSAKVNVKYNINNTGWIEDSITTPIPAGAYYEHAFSTPVDLSATGSYRIQVVVNSALDNNPANDTLTALVRQIDNPSIDLTMPFVDSFATVVQKIYTSSQTGLEGKDRYDYFKESGGAKLACGPAILNDGFIGRPGLKLTMGTSFGVTGRHRLAGTYNLAAYDTAVHNILLKFDPSTGIIGNQKILIRGNDTLPWVVAWEMSGANPSALVDTTSPIIHLSAILRNAGQNFSSSFQVAFDHWDSYLEWSIAEIDLIDVTHDVELARIDSIRSSGCNMGSAVPFSVQLANYGMQPVTNLPVKYRLNGGPVMQETVAQIPPYSSVNYLFNSRLNLAAPGIYTIEAWIESAADTYTSNNNKKLVVHNQPVISAFPYLEDFEKNDGSWYTEGINSSWEYGTPASSRINEAASGQKVWKTNLNGNYNDLEYSYLYSPCFDLSGMKRPMISFSMTLNMDQCFPALQCDNLALQYSTDGVTWALFPRNYSYYNWDAFWSGEKKLNWKVATNILPAAPQVRLRFWLRSNNYLNLEGAAIDDIHIYDSVGYIYSGPSTVSPVEKNITGGKDWIHFIKDNAIIASIHPHNQDIGLTNAGVSIDTSEQRNFHGQYYLNRNFLVTSEKKPVDSIGIRLYFRDSEVDTLLTAHNCLNCTKPSHAHRFGVSAYTTDSVAEYNQSIPDHVAGVWTFLDRSRVRIVPFDDGYYAEFKVKDLSEFWLSSGGLDNKSYLPVRFTSTAVEKTNSTDARLSWSTAMEINIHHFEIEAAKGNAAYKHDNYAKVGEVMSGGRSAQTQAYTYTDASGDKTGAYYYRVKAVDEFGNYSYSKPVPVVWSNELLWQVYPNPAPDGAFTLQYQADNNEAVQVYIYNAIGQLVKQQQLKGNGFIQQTVIQLDKRYATGVYWLRAQVGEQVIMLKLIK